ncbi:MAG: transcription repressor NadR [Defluviitaleaceae bacterium]|nr:transcription repressor NadR [Defluviitaleaceae bacterium]
MDARLRRKEILTIINAAQVPVSASTLAKKFDISRQVVVGDVALLRAKGHDIIATARGYMMPQLRDDNHYMGKMACCHAPQLTRDELYAIVDLNASVINVIVEHEVYGEITGQLNLKSREDVNLFMDKVEQSEIKLLSELTNGVHLHTIGCRDKAHFEHVYERLKRAGYLLEE